MVQFITFRFTSGLKKGIFINIDVLNGTIKT